MKLFPEFNNIQKSYRNPLIKSQAGLADREFFFCFCNCRFSQFDKTENTILTEEKVCLDQTRSFLFASNLGVVLLRRPLLISVIGADEFRML